MTMTFHPLARGRMNAICLPSGDHAGKLSRPFFVSARRPDPSTFMLKIPTPSRTNAIRLPSGENAGGLRRMRALRELLETACRTA